MSPRWTSMAATATYIKMRFVLFSVTKMGFFIELNLSPQFYTYTRAFIPTCSRTIHLSSPSSDCESCSISSHILITSSERRTTSSRHWRRRTRASIEKGRISKSILLVWLELYFKTKITFLFQEACPTHPLLKTQLFPFCYRHTNLCATKLFATVEFGLLL